MNLERIGTLVIPNIKKTVLSRYAFWIYGIFGFFILVDLGLKWNGRSVTLLFVLLESCCASRESSLLSVLHEHFSLIWVLVSLVFLLPKLLSPLGDSFLVSSILWLRFTPCLPYEVALLRVFSVVLCSIWLGALGMLWALINSFVHQVSLVSLLSDVEGLVSYTLFTGGLVSVLDFGLSVDYSGRRFISTFALLSPFLLLLVFILIGNIKYAKYFPYTIPFITIAPPHNQLSVAIPYHFGAAAVLGTVLLCFHVMSKLQYSSVEPKTGGIES